MNLNKIKKLNEYMTKARKLILLKYNPDSCILSTAVMIAICKKLGIKGVEPFSCSVIVYNPIASKIISEFGYEFKSQEDIDNMFAKGGYSVGIGIGDPKKGSWGGHLIVVGKDFLLDPSLDQAARSQYNISLTCLLGLLSDSESRKKFNSFKNGEQKLIYNQNDCLIIYTKINRDYTISPDWKNKDRINEIVKAVLKK